MIQITKHSNVYRLDSQQLIHQTLDTVWEYFSMPANLQELTPNDLDFNILSPSEQMMFEGQIIIYKIGIFPLLKSTWVTEITQVQDRNYFIDEQRFGPYALWHHRHSFVETDEGVLMKDTVHFKLPFGVIGRLFYPFIKNKLFKIFKFRFERVEHLFNSKNKNK